METGSPGKNPLERPYEDLNAKDILCRRRILAWIKMCLDGADPGRVHDLC